MWVWSDIGFGGNRMPVSISHIYNTNDSMNNDFGMGYGWRTNFNQLVYDKTNYLNTLAYGNGDSVQYTYDQLGRVTQESYYEDNSTTVSDTVKYQYDNDGALAAVIDSETGITSKYYYDFIDRLCKYTESGENYSLIMEYGFDKMNNMTTIVETINGNRRSSSITYDLDNRVTSLRKGSVTEAYTYDDYSRVSDKTTTISDETRLTEHITYRAPSTGITTGQIASLTIDAANHDVTYSYTYDKNGNILSVSDGTHTTTYTYDSANQLTRENNQAEDKTWTWTYDNAGNILSRSEYGYTTGDLSSLTPMTVSYAYTDADWGDLLTSYNGQTIQYDEIGNPLTDGTWTYTWQHGRELASMTDGSTTWNYTYNADGLRTKRTNGSLTYQYYYADGQLVRIAVGNKYLDISYDASGTPMSLYYSGYQVGDAKGNYYYVTNVQGDVVAIVNDAGEAGVTYTSDAWGNILEVDGSMASTLGVYNPLRYRGYVYDNETGLYYVSSRYYDPEIGRFINADSQLNQKDSILGFNMFAYCHNNPIMYSDPTI